MATRTPEQKAAHAKHEREKYRALSPEDRKAASRARRERFKKQLAEASPEKREEIRAMHRAATAEWSKSPEGRAYHAAYMREWNRKNPEKVKEAQKRAVERGKGKRAYQRIITDPARKARLVEWHRERYRKDPETACNKRAAYKYGITPDEYAERMSRDCEICGTRYERKSGSGKIRGMAIDHCHATGKLRGTLCGRCNTALGLLDDDTGRLQKAIDYLTNYSTDRRTDHVDQEDHGKHGP